EPGVAGAGRTMQKDKLSSAADRPDERSNTGNERRKRGQPQGVGQEHGKLLSESTHITILVCVGKRFFPNVLLRRSRPLGRSSGVFAITWSIEFVIWPRWKAEQPSLQIPVEWQCALREAAALETTGLRAG